MIEVEKPLVLHMADDLYVIDYRPCQVIDGPAMDFVRTEIGKMVGPQPRAIRLMVKAGNISHFSLDPAYSSANTTTFSVKKSAWVVDEANHYMVARMLDGLNLTYETAVFNYEAFAKAWLDQ